jgi:hypothetical protein
VKRFANASIYGGRFDAMPKPYLQHLKSSQDLETTREAVRAGFVRLALERNHRATPYVAKARALKAAAIAAATPADLLKLDEIRPALLAAAGISDKASAYLAESDKLEAIRGLIENFLEPAGDNFVEELVFRFLLTRGDTLGGSMRNIGGFMAQQKLTRAIIACLAIAGRRCQWLDSDANIWAEVPVDNADIDRRASGLHWQTKKSPRTLLYKHTVSFLKSNADLALFKCAPEDLAEISRTPSAFIALGELKGGIDPAGADEHWKTARSSLNRINEKFSAHGRRPHTFFIGAAIEARMAREIWEMLKDGIFENAANLTKDDHIASISRWICGL